MQASFSAPWTTPRQLWPWISLLAESKTMRWTKTLTVVDCHAEGESGQVVVGGVIDVPGETAFDKRVYLETQMDQVRRMILFEPGGRPTTTRTSCCRRIIRTRRWHT